MPCAIAAGRNHLLRAAGSVRERQSANDRGGLKGDRLKHGFDPTSRRSFTAAICRDSLRGSTISRHSARLRSGSRRCSRTSRCRAGRGRNRRAITVTGSPTSPVSIRTLATKRRCRLSSRSARAWHEGVSRHHRQSHRGRDRVPRMSDGPCPYRSRAEYPYSRRGGLQGAAINEGFEASGSQRRELREAHERRLRIHAILPAGEEQHQGAAVAERSAALSQPRQHDVRGRELGDRRLRRARRPHDRESARRAGHDRHLRGLDRSLRCRRLPHRHCTACESRVLAGVRARDAAAGGGAGHPAFSYLR